MVSRRQTLKLVGGTAVGFGAVTGVVGAERGDNGGKSGENRPTTRVHPFGDQQVPVGHAIEHSVGWVEGCGSVEERKENVSEFLENVELTVDIEGVDVDAPHQYWGEPIIDGDLVFVWWKYVTDPRPPGEYDFDLTLGFSEPYTSRHPDDDCEPRTREGTTFVGDTVYEVTPEAGAGSGKK